MPWSSRRYFLDKMTLRDLVWAYVTYPAIQIYALLSVVGIGLAVHWGGSPLRLLAATAVTLLIYPLVEYLLHRFLLHGRLLYRFPQTAALRKRIHFDHHQDPNDLGVLFGALHTTLPPIFVIAGPIGWLIGGISGAALAVPRSETVFNLGYTGAESGRFPWVAMLSGLAPGAPVLWRGRQE